LKEKQLMKQRCQWAGSDPLYVSYHDIEWGTPVFDDRVLFEFLILEGMQAGLSWLTILRKRENFRNAFDNFDALKISNYGEKDIKRLLNNDGIIRNRLKINAAIENARQFLKVQEDFGQFSEYIWRFVNHKPLINKWKSMKDIPATTPLSEKMSKELKKRGFKFVGSTICYAFMQATGMVNDHQVDCFRYSQLISTRRQSSKND
jgi:DNA-3-methyladenine glycosylase I